MSISKRVVATSRKVGYVVRARVTRRRHTTATATATATAQPIDAASASSGSVEAVATEAAVTSNADISKLLASLADEVEATATETKERNTAIEVREKDVEACKKATLKACKANARYKATANKDRNEAGVEYHLGVTMALTCTEYHQHDTYNK
ncbi:hypothetical protein IW146_007288 [Coemansia sp. RSA 922]|nr:hypothetical protein H4S03_007056 [Coemansia sp. S3946]KAJ2051417.1 hypothetical protein GGI08_005272 [Coemansia sp. S2]KAJ2107502.1 hypothetical protein IW146_007288 [Coemansia sp. RSA 922]KAJ2348062.1 hypothetical protein GGH92_002963 [Coemansia sp. RSA 2673]